MAHATSIQWADSTTNPLMGCPAGCELFPPPGKVRSLFLDSVLESYPELDGTALKAHLQKIFESRSTTEIWHERRGLVQSLVVACDLPLTEASAVQKLLEKHIKCYAAHLHLRHGLDHTNPLKTAHKGYAPKFEEFGLFPGRTTTAAGWTDLRGQTRQSFPWKDGLPRLIFVSDMGDALSPGVSFEFLKKEIVDVARSQSGSSHIWQWLTKRPNLMAEFSAWLTSHFGPGAWPDNLVAMTSVTSQQTAYRVDHLRKVECRFRGLSVEPLWSSVELNLQKIDWVICGGESGGGAEAFELNWARALHKQCIEANTAFFMKQLGAAPLDGGTPLKLRDKHGGDWGEWPEDLQTREFPKTWYEPFQI